MSEIRSQLDIGADEVSSLTDYIRRKNTAVLTVMFTDIQGFTEVTERKGEEYSRDLRRHHDAILSSAIEDDGAGLVIKFIGDAVMAVFSEPSAAVNAALEIQQRIQTFNVEHPELEDLLVRIGMHMGQVAVEDNLQTDVFGRHVNRAARIESLAAGGHIYMSEPVFDSARGWLGGRDDLGWTLHGSYYLKGIDKPVEIYEVCDARVQQPQPPQGARRKRTLPRVGGVVVVASLALVALAAWYWLRPAEVWLTRPYPQDLRVDGERRVALEGDAEDDQRKLMTDLEPGRHVLHYDVARGVRYYAAIDVVRGENVMSPRYRESRLPAIAVRSGVRDGEKREASRRRTFELGYMDSAGEWQVRAGELVVSTSSRRSPEDPDRVLHRFQWRITRDAGLVEEGVVEAEHRVSAPRSTRIPPVVLVEQPPYFFFYSYYTLKESAEFTLGAHFEEHRPTQ